MLTRCDFEAREKQFLSAYATCSAESKGRQFEEAPCEIRTAFQRDRDRIIHSKAFRRLKHKTQVFISPESDHYRTRLTHTLEVAGIARTIARGLALNEDLAEAIALGHDLGHTPFGHAGEHALNAVFPGGFHHNQQSLRIVDYLEVRTNSDGEQIFGLNLTAEVRDGILNHNGSDQPFTLEGQIVRLADRIAYINHDIDDALRARVIASEDLPGDLLKILGTSNSKRIDLMVRDIIISSWDQPEIRQNPEVKEAMRELREWMFTHVYRNALTAKAEDDKAERVIKEVYAYFAEHPELIPEEYSCLYFEKKENLPRIVVDYIAGMSDRYALSLAREIFFPKPWLK